MGNLCEMVQIRMQFFGCQLPQQRKIGVFKMQWVRMIPLICAHRKLDTLEGRNVQEGYSFAKEFCDPTVPILKSFKLCKR